MRETLVTGASRGIGRAVANLLHRKGQSVIGIARHPADDFPGRLFTADLASPEETAQVLLEIHRSHCVTRIVNNVGVANPQPISEVEPDTFHRTVDLNLRSAIQVTQSCLPAMRQASFGRIVNISSRAAYGREFRTSYSAAKSAMIGMSRSWALELASEGITVNVVAPGLTETVMMRRNNPDIERRIEKVPMGRLAKPEEIASAVDFFLCERSSYTTGQVLSVCGGLSVGFSGI